jgi:hypothetical protein
MPRAKIFAYEQAILDRLDEFHNGGTTEVGIIKFSIALMRGNLDSKGTSETTVQEITEAALNIGMVNRDVVQAVAHVCLKLGIRPAGLDDYELGGILYREIKRRLISMVQAGNTAGCIRKCPTNWTLPVFSKSNWDRWTLVLADEYDQRNQSDLSNHISPL